MHAWLLLHQSSLYVRGFIAPMSCICAANAPQSWDLCSHTWHVCCETAAAVTNMLGVPACRSGWQKEIPRDVTVIYELIMDKQGYAMYAESRFMFT